MNVGLSELVLFIVTTKKDFKCASVPILYVDNQEDMEYKSSMISKCLGGMVQQADIGIFMVVKH